MGGVLTAVSESLKDQYRDSTNLQARIDLHARFSTATRDFHAWVFDQYDLPASARVLEIGCGTGLLWEKNRKRIPTTWRLTLTDFSVGMVTTARQTLTAQNLSARYVHNDAQALPFLSDSFDALIANHMLFHVPDIPRAIAEIRRVLTRGGKLYAATNGRGHLQELFDIAGRFLGKPIAHDGMRFKREDGGAMLAAELRDVRRIDYPDELVVTEVEPLMAFILV